ncbi:MAG: ABC transporter ATP-binding protein [Alphaproteobacteria bacterium]
MSVFSASPQDFAAVDSTGLCVRVAHFAFDGQPLFADLELVAVANGWTCLLGASGVGKTTLLRMIAGLVPGAVCTSNGAPLTGRMSYMAQQDLLLPWLSALDNVTLGARLRGVPAQGAQALDLLDQVGIADQAAKLPAQLSGGQRQRVALARTLMEDRPVVLMDEPFSAVDAVNRQRLQILAAKLLHGRTVILITHDPQEALLLGDKILVMSGQPVTLDDVAVPATARPRQPDDPDLIRLQQSLMERLGAALEDADRAR